MLPVPRALSRLLRRAVVKQAPRARVRMKLEEIEPRILHSADLMPAPMVPQAEIRVLELSASSIDAAAAASATVTAQPASGREVLFVDSSVHDYEALVAALLSDAGDDRRIEVIVLDAAREGIGQVSEALRSGSELAGAVHFITHGTEGAVKLGSTWLRADDLRAHEEALAAWGSTLAVGADLYLYGCNVAETADGRALLDRLHELTGANVAASADVTGTGGNWVLEHAVGAVSPTGVLTLDAGAGWSGALASVTVSTTNDVVDGNTTSIAALLASRGADGAISLREALIAANNTAGTDDISLGAGTYVLSKTGNDDLAATGDFDIRDSVNITGAGSSSTIINGNALDRLFHAISGTSTISDLTLRNGSYTQGGAIALESIATLTLDRVVISGNAATSQGGGVQSTGTLYMNDVRLTGNSVSNGQGAALYNAGSATLNRVTIDGNTGKTGGGISNTAAGTLTLTNVTISGNSASTQTGGGIHNAGQVTATNVTITGNSAGTLGGGINNNGGTVTLKNTIVAGNTATTGPDVNGAIASSGNNLIGNTLGSSGWVASDRQNVASGLDPVLAANGGFAPTHQILAGSVAIHTGSATGAPLVDQRGIARDAAPDIGAYEYATPGQVLWHSSAVSATAGGQTWNNSTIAQLGDPNLVLTAGTTTGTLSTRNFDLNTFAADGAVNMNGFHYVSRAVTVGTGNALALQAGDLLLSTATNETLGGVVVSAKDIILFRPTAPGDYSAGAFSILLAAPMGTGLTRDFALVETATVVGGVTLNAGDFLLTASTAAYRKDIWRYEAVDVGPLTSVGTLSELVDGSSAGIGFAEDVYGIELVQANATLGGRALTAGQLLISLAAADTVGSNSLAVTQYDIFVLDVAATGIGTSSGTASLLVKGSDLGISAAGEEYDAIALLPFAPTVASSNTAPVLNSAASPALAAVNEDAGAPVGAVGTLVSSLVDGPGGGGLDNATDADAGAVLGIAVTAADTTGGTWWYSTNDGANWNALGPVSNNAAKLLAADASTRIYFEPAADYNGTIASALTFRAWDRTSGTAGGAGDATVNGGSSAFSAATDTASLTVTAVNDAPTGADATLVAFEDTARVIDHLAFGFSDPADAGAHSFSAVKITTLPTAGTLTLNGVAVTAGQVIDAVDLAANQLRFTAAPDASGTGYATFTFQVQDSGLTLNGGVDLDATPRTMTIDVTAVNDAPEGASATVIAFEDTDYTLFATAFGFDDGVDGGSHSLSAVRIASLPTAGTLSLGGSAVTLGQSISAADLLAGNLKFRAAANASGTGYASFTFQVQDTGGTDNGGVDLDTIARILTFDVTAVNDAPAGAPGTVTAVEDTDYTFTAPDFTLTDAADATANNLLAVRITTLTATGTLKLSGAAVTAGQVIAASDITLGNLKYTPAADASGTASASFTFQVQDDGGIANGGVDLDGTARTMTIDLTAVNDAPVGASAAVAAVEDTAYVFETTDFGFSDPTDSGAHILSAVKIVSLPGAGTLALNGVAVTAGQVISVADIVADRLRFTAASNANGTGYASFTFRVQDSGATANGGIDLDTVARTMTIDVSAVNDAPSNSVPGAQNTSSNTPVFFSTGGGNAITIGDPDAGGAPIQVTLSATNGVLTLNGVAGLSFSAGTGSANASMTFTGSAAAINTALDGLRYDPTAAYSGPAQLTVTSDDLGNSGAGGAHSTTNTVAISVAYMNTAPVLTGSANLTGIIEDAAGNGGTLVSALVAATDPDAAAVTGIAVTGVDNTNGTWQYSLNLGASWTAFAAPSVDDALLLAADANTFVRFVPDANWHGTVTNGITFRAWDQTSGTAGTVARTSPLTPHVLDDFSSVSYNNQHGSANWATPWTDTDGAGAGGGQITVSGGELSMSGALLSSTNSIQRAVDLTGASSANLSFGFNNGVGGTTIELEISKNGAPFVLLTNSFAAGPGSKSIDISSYISPNTRIMVTISSGVLGSGTFTMDDVKIDYVIPFSGGASAFSTGTASSSITVAPVNDAPAGASSVAGVAEDGALTLTIAHFGFTDPDDSPAHTLSEVRIATLPAAGVLKLDGVAVTAGQFVTRADIEAFKLVYTPVADANGTAYASFTFQVRDNGLNSDGGVDLESDAHTLTIDVASVNDAPEGADATVSTKEDTPYVLRTADFGFSDPDDAVADDFSAVTITTLPGAGALMLNNVAVTAGQLVSAADIAANRLEWRPVANANGTGYGSFTFQVKDDAGGTDTDTTARTLTLDVTAVNDAPSGTSKTVTAFEDTPFTFTTGDFGFSDGVEGHGLQAVKITSLPAAGSLRLNGVAVTAGQSVSAADILANRLVFTAAPNANGTGYAAFTFMVQDDGRTDNGGIDLAAAETLTINVAAVNDAPSGVSKSFTILEEGAVVFTTPDFGFSDAIDGNSLLAVKITGLPGAGSLTLDGVIVTAGQVVSKVDIDAGKLRFDPAANANGTAYASFAFRVQDDGLTANGGVDLATAARTMTINVTAVNDAPSGTSTTVAALEDTPFTFATGDFGFSDGSDGHSLHAVRIMSLPAAGALKLDGVAVTAGQSVSAADILANKLVFTPALNASGTGHASFTFVVQDNGGTINGGIDLAAAKTLTIDVAAVNDAPTGADRTVSVAEDGAHTFSALDFGFLDTSDAPANTLLAVKITTLPVAGALRLNGVAVAAGQSVSVADINANKLVYTPAADANGTSYASFTFQVRDNGGGADLDTTARTMTVDVTAVNDAPAGADRTVSVAEDGAHTFSALDFGFLDTRDAPANTLLAVKITTPPVAGALRLDGVAVAAGQFVSVADINANKLVYTPAADANGTSYASFTFQVQDNGGGADLDTTARTMTVDVTAVNDAPAGADRTVSVAEDGAHTFSALDFGFLDTRDAPANTLLAVKITTPPVAGALRLDGVAVAAGQFVSVADINANKVVYTPAADANGTSYASFTFQVQDNGGGADLDVTARTITVDVSPVNDAPAGVDRTVSIAEDGAHVFSALDLGFGDTNDAPANTLLAVKITSVPAAGALRLDGVAVVAGQLVSVADIDANKLVFTPATNASGMSYASFTFQVQDNGGGADLDTVARTLTIDVTPVNDAPVGQGTAVSMVAGTTHGLTRGSFGFSDPGDTPADRLLAVRISTLPGGGTLTANGVAVTPGQHISAADIDAGGLVFRASSAGTATFTFQVQDDGAGSDLDAVARTLMFNVSAAPRQEIVQQPVPEPVVIVAPVLDTRVQTSTTSSVASSSGSSSSVSSASSAYTSTSTSATTTGSTTPAASPAGTGSTESAAAEGTVEGGSERAAGTAAADAAEGTSPRAPVAGDDTRGGVTTTAAAAAAQGQVNVLRPDGVQVIKDVRDAVALVPVDSQALAQLQTGGLGGGSLLLAQQAQSSSAAALATPEARALGHELDQLRDSMKDQNRLESATVAATAATGMSLSVGYVVWLLRGGALLSTFLSSLPAWRFIDPLPVLGRIDGDDGDDDDDSLESMVATGDTAHDDTPRPDSGDVALAEASEERAS